MSKYFSTKISPISFGPLPEQRIQEVIINDQCVSVIYSLSYEDFIAAVQKFINSAIGDNPFVSTAVVDMLFDLVVISEYTNIDLKEIEDLASAAEIYEVYDIIRAHAVLPQILPLIDSQQWAALKHHCFTTLENIMTYRNSARGLLEIAQAASDNSGNVLQDALSNLDSSLQSEQLSKLMTLFNPAT